MASQTIVVYEAMHVVFHSNFAAYIVCRRYKPCEFLGFVWTNCWGKKSNYVITSPANINRSWVVANKYVEQTSRPRPQCNSRTVIYGGTVTGDRKFWRDNSNKIILRTYQFVPKRTSIIFLRK